jgi:hypothetical protein
VDDARALLAQRRQGGKGGASAQEPLRGRRPTRQPRGALDRPRRTLSPARQASALAAPAMRGTTGRRDPPAPTSLNEARAWLRRPPRKDKRLGRLSRPAVGTSRAFDPASTSAAHGSVRTSAVFRERKATGLRKWADARVGNAPRHPPDSYGRKPIKASRASVGVHAEARSVPRELSAETCKAVADAIAVVTAMAEDRTRLGRLLDELKHSGRDQGWEDRKRGRARQ